jgi:16S rRNA (cytidine1402-2'-O)-methyltransferase
LIVSPRNATLSLGMQSHGTGRLYVVGTPIGNLDDLSPRAIVVLRDVSLILCEDTRHTRKLLSHFAIETATESFHEHNEKAKAERLLGRVQNGESLALVSDAGMPLLSDPGYAIVRLARERGVVVEPVPGPFAGVLALVASGIAPLPFMFFGFAPHRQAERRDFYREVADRRVTSILYESPERIVDSLRDALETLGDVECTVGREMTKIHEEFLHGSLREVVETLASRDSIRGEITIVLAAAAERQAETAPEVIAAEFERLRASGMRRNDAIKVVAEKFGLRKNDVYKVLVGG